MLVLLCIAGAALGRFQTQARNRGQADPVTLVINQTVSPIAGPLASWSQGVGDFVGGSMNGRSLVEENERLRALARSAELYQEQLARLERDIDALRRLNQLPELAGRTRVAADVIGFFFKDNRITLNVGSRAGVQPGLAVQNADGLVGVVQSVTPTQCQVLLVTSSSLNNGNGIGALDISRNPPPAGLLKGENSSTMKLTFHDPKAPAQTGDVVVTTGYSEKIPRGIPLGRIIQVEDDPEYGARRAVVDPFMSPGQLREVHVLR